MPTDEPLNLSMKLALAVHVAEDRRPVAARHPGLWHYEFILKCIAGALTAPDARAKYDALVPLAVFAVREFDGATGDYERMASMLHDLIHDSRVLAGVSIEEFWQRE